MLISKCLRCLHKVSRIQKCMASIINLNGSAKSCTVLPCRTFYLTACTQKRRKTAEERKMPRIIEYPPKPKGEIVDVWRNITVGELAKVLNSNIDYVEALFIGNVKGSNTIIEDIKELQGAIRRSGRRMRIVARPVPNKETKAKEIDVFPRPPPSKDELKPRPPVVTVMGHVDHGKTTLLDALRNSRVVDKEFGGITQHIGAFSIDLPSKGKVTFLDTPGHAAFTSMRARGANVTDIVVLVVAADDGVMEQTLESIRMARQANVPIIVAINKIDSPKADIEKTEQMLMEIGLQSEQLGGDVQVVHVSALKKTNLDALIEAILTQAEVMGIGGDPTGLVEAVVVESHVNEHRGKLCTVIVQRGTLKKGKVLVAGVCFAKVRLLRDSDGEILKEVSPGYATEIEGWRDLPEAGDRVLEVESEKRARAVIEFREEKEQESKLKEDEKVITMKENEHRKEYLEYVKLKRSMGRFKLKRTGPRKPEIMEDDKNMIRVIVKGDVNGTLEAILETLDTYQEQDCEMDIVHYGIGAITENDVELAEAFKGVIYAFNVECPDHVKEKAEEVGVVIKHHNVIYKLIDDLKEEINSRLPSKEVEEILGEATVLQQIFINDKKKKVPVAGCRCTKGTLKKSSLYRVIRNGETIHEGTLSSMRHLKDEVNSIKINTECGLQLSDKTITFEPGDIIVSYEKRLAPQTTAWDPGF